MNISEKILLLSNESIADELRLVDVPFVGTKLCYFSTYYGASIKAVYPTLQDGRIRICCIENSNRKPVRMCMALVDDGYNVSANEKYINTLRWEDRYGNHVTKHVLISEVN